MNEITYQNCKKSINLHGRALFIELANIFAVCRSEIIANLVSVCLQKVKASAHVSLP